MPNYQSGKIYKIVNDIDDRIYIGSTTYPLHKRLYKHKTSAARGKQRTIVTSMFTMGELNILKLFLLSYFLAIQKSN